MDSIGKRLEQIVSKENVKYNEPMYKHTTFKTGGKIINDFQEKEKP